MNKAMLAVGIIFLAIITFMLINLVQDYSRGTELDYYLLKETVEASMSDAVDYNLIKQTGLLRIDKEMFMESFVRRFADNVEAVRTYNVKVFDINETPPRVSVRVESQTYANFGDATAPIITDVDAILETKAVNNGFYRRVNAEMNDSVAEIFAKVKKVNS